ncbi:MAG: hypothetical protein IH918_09185 [Acidobacteria bacterium]|nr:hypothetical protein [Acidobacteriota bacterium]
MEIETREVRQLVPSLIRGLVAAAAASLISLPLVNALFAEELTFWMGLGAALVGGLTTLAVFLGVALLLRSPELREIRRRG